MLRRIRLRNFKSWADTKDVELRRLTLLFGSNNSGKSSLLQSLLLMKQTVESADRTQPLFFGDENSHTDLGNFETVVSEHKLTKTIKFSFAWDSTRATSFWLTGERRAQLKRNESHLVELSSEVGIKRSKDIDRVVLENLRYEFLGAKIELTREKTASKSTNFKYKLRARDFNRSRVEHTFPLRTQMKAYAALPSHHLGLELPSMEADPSDVILDFERLMRSVIYIGPLREHPRRMYVWGGNLPQTVGQGGEAAVDALLADRAAGKRVRGSPSPERIVANWLKQIGLVHSFDVRPIARGRKEYELWVRSAAKAPEVLLPDIGFGVSQLMPILVQLAVARRGSIVLLEQPELHLHPAAQSFLADVLIEAMRQRSLQLIIETHSEHLLRRVQRRIAEKNDSNKLTEGDVAVYFCRKDGPFSRIEQLQTDAGGRILNWPKGFFGDLIADLAAIAEANVDLR